MSSCDSSCGGPHISEWNPRDHAIWWIFTALSPSTCPSWSWCSHTGESTRQHEHTGEGAKITLKSSSTKSETKIVIIHCWSGWVKFLQQEHCEWREAGWRKLRPQDPQVGLQSIIRGVYKFNTYDPTRNIFLSSDHHSNFDRLCRPLLTRTGPFSN